MNAITASGEHASSRDSLGIAARARSVPGSERRSINARSLSSTELVRSACPSLDPVSAAPQHVLFGASLGLIACVALVLTACSFDRSSMVFCRADNECLPGQYCSPEVKVCLYPAQLDIEADENELELDPELVDLPDQPDAEELCAFCTGDNAKCCDGRCVNLKNDSDHCGDCGAACSSVEVCLGGNCTCPSGTQNCGAARCIDVFSNPYHCGECFNDCDFNCFDAVCSCGKGYCLEPDLCCPLASGESTTWTFDDFLCINVQEDPFNCGQCGVVCGEGEYCEAGLCTCGEMTSQSGPACAANHYCCDGRDCLPDEEPCQCGTTPRCTNNGETVTYCCDVGGLDQCVPSNNEHCGPRCKSCPSGTFCEFDQCRCPTDMPNNCGGVCVNVVNDVANCGGCGMSCAQGTSCCDRQCVQLESDALNCGGCGQRCGVGQACCAGACVDVRSNPSHCGACDWQCGESQSCVNGTCACPAGFADCGDCVDMLSDENHCGACGSPCAETQICCGGSCVTLGTSAACVDCNPCPGATQCCAGTCVDVTASVQNCGACSQACPAAQACCNGECKLGCGTCSSCEAPLVCCADEDCANLASSAQHCGGCGLACAPGNACCNGACADTSSLEHCGGCGMTCTGTAPVCCSGSCASDLLSDSSHCGACGVSCQSGWGCCADGGGSALCRDFKNDRNNCGSCARKCASDESCDNGQCKDDGCQLSRGPGHLPLWMLLFGFAFWRLQARRRKPTRQHAPTQP